MTATPSGSPPTQVPNSFKGGMFLVAETDPRTLFTPEDFSDTLRQIAETTDTFAPAPQVR